MAGTILSLKDPVDPVVLPSWFIALRILLTVCMVYMTVMNLTIYALAGYPEFWPIYFTNWAQCWCTATMIVKCVSSLKMARLTDDELVKPLEPHDKTWRLYLAQSVMLQTALPAISLVAFKCVPSLCYTCM